MRLITNQAKLLNLKNLKDLNNRTENLHFFSNLGTNRDFSTFM